MGRIFALIVAIALVVSAGLFYFSPTIAFYDIRSACKSTDIEALAKLIDFDSVRTSLKAQLDAGPQGVAAPGPSPLSDPVGATGKALKSIGDSIGSAVNGLVNPNAPKTPPVAVIDPNIFLTPNALLALTYGYGADAPRVQADELGKAPAPQVDFFSLDRVRLTVKEVDHGTTTFTFERRGLTRWVLVHVGLPKPGDESRASANPAE